MGPSGSRDGILGPSPQGGDEGGAQPSSATQGLPVPTLWEKRGEEQQEKPLKLFPEEQLTAFPYSILLRVASVLIILFLSPLQSSLPFFKSPCQAIL